MSSKVAFLSDSLLSFKIIYILYFRTEQVVCFKKKIIAPCYYNINAQKKKQARTSQKTLQNGAIVSRMFHNAPQEPSSPPNEQKNIF